MKTLLIYILCCLQDLLRGLRHNYHSPLEATAKKLYYQLIITSHTLEKGLSFKSPKQMFGRVKIKQVIGQMQGYDGSCGSFPVAMARGALDAYRKHHLDAGIQDPLLDEINEAVEASRKKIDCVETGGVNLIDADPAKLPANAIDRRFSCRHYTPEAVSAELIDTIVKRAQRAPSQCNRQSSRVHCYQDRNDIDRLLALQGGSAGFSDKVANLFVVGSELTAWGGPGQRNQAYVDGSLFAMCLMLACVEEGLHCCPLNLAVTNKKEKQIAEQGHIPHDQRLIMMIAFGHCDLDPLRAAASPRLTPDQVLTLHTGPVNGSAS